MIDVFTHIAGRYRVDARLGGGGMADVFEAYDEVLDRPVAVKILRGIDDAGAARRFAEEIRLTARVNHPNIVRLFNAGEHEGSPYLVLERVSGGTLAGEMAAGPMDSRRVAAMGEQLASALSHSHAAGIVHRDVKPTNVLLTNEGNVRLADFGIAITATATRLTVAGSVAGSAGYVSPEQVLGTGADAASDIYSLGLVLLECLVGAPPWSGTTVEVALARISADPQIPSTLPDGWEPLLRAMTARQPEDRPSIDLVGYALSLLAKGEVPDARLFATELDEPRTDRRVPAVAGMSVLLLLFSAILVLSSQSPPEPAVATVDPVSVSNFTTAAAHYSPLAAEHAAVAAAEAEAAAKAAAAAEAAREREERIAERRRERRREARLAAREQGSGTTGTSGDGSLLDTVLGDTSPVRGTADTTDTVRDVTDPVTTSPTLIDKIDSVSEAAQILNKGKGKGGAKADPRSGRR